MEQLASGVQFVKTCKVWDETMMFICVNLRLESQTDMVLDGIETCESKI